MKRHRSLRFQVRLLVSCIGGVLAALFMAPYALPLVQIGNVVVAGILGVVLFLLLATAAGLIWRRSIMTAPIRWGLASPVILPVTIYLALRLISGFDPSEARIAADASLVSGFCAIFASAIFVVWSRMAPVDQGQSG